MESRLAQLQTKHDAIVALNLSLEKENMAMSDMQSHISRLQNENDQLLSQSAENKRVIVESIDRVSQLTHDKEQLTGFVTLAIPTQ